MDRIKIQFVALILVIFAMLALAYTGAQAIWISSNTTPTPKPALQTSPTARPSPVPTPESGVMMTKYGYNITYPPSLGLQTIQKPVERLGTPVPGLPIEGQSFSHYPRKTILVWSPIVEATDYQLEIETGDGGQDGGLIKWQEAQTLKVQDSSYLFTINGPLTCRWRVTAFDRTHLYAPSQPSEWQTLTYMM